MQRPVNRAPEAVLRALRGGRAALRGAGRPAGWLRAGVLTRYWLPAAQKAQDCSHCEGGLEEVVAREMGVSRQAVIAQLVGAADLARELREPASMISAFRNVAQICGYYRQEEVAAAPADAGGLVMERLRGMSDQELMRMVEAGA